MHVISAVSCSLLAGLAFLHHDHDKPVPRSTDGRFVTSRPSPIALPLPDEKDAFFFAVFGDRTSGPPEGVKVLAQAVSDVNLLTPDLVMTVGDLVQGYNETPAWMTQALEYKGIMDRLKCPWFPVVGNHDIYWRGKSAKPKTEHEHDFETFFGPLWYAFEHKNSWFIALYSDESTPDGKRTFDDPAGQRMSAEQFTWLSGTLARAKNAQNVFVFLHHPRWLRGNYGDDWERVHQKLVEAGNVKAVFAGHIHRMRYDGNKDGIEYFTLATVGGVQDAFSSTAGYLHQYSLVVVRDGKISVASYPVGVAMDPRQITGVISDDVATLAHSLVSPNFTRAAAFAKDLSVDGEVSVRIANPTTRPLEVTLTPDSADSRWNFAPDHQHGQIEAGKTKTFTVFVRRTKNAIDSAFRGPELAVRIDYLAESLRVPLPERRWTLPIDSSTLPAPAVPATERTLALDGKRDCLEIQSTKLALPDGPMTIEGWLNAESFDKRVGFLNKTEGSEFGIFVSNGIPSFSLHIGGKYVNVGDKAKQALSVHAWHHVAGVFDGGELRLYVDGHTVGAAAGAGKRDTNELPLLIGADVTNEGKPDSFFHGEIDEIRVSKIARYAGESFAPARRFERDDDTVVLLHMDGEIGPWSHDSSGLGAHATLLGKPVPH